MPGFTDRGEAATTVYNPYKIFQAAQRCMGDPSVVAKVLVELLGHCATPDVLMASAASVLELYYSKGGLRKSSMTDFGKFAEELADELGKRDSLEVTLVGRRGWLVTQHHLLLLLLHSNTLLELH